MNFKYTLPDHLVKKVANMAEFANGGTQVTIRLKDGGQYNSALISNCMWIVAMRGHKDLPFDLSEIEDVFQTELDKRPAERGNWEYWDNWQ